jgi:hypothetical protein
MADISPALQASQDAGALTDLLSKVDALRAANPVPGAPTIIEPIIPFPIHLPQTTTVLRGATTVGYIVTPGGDPAPTGAGVVLKSGILWVQASLLGAEFSAVPGFAGVPFSGATIKATGSVTFSAGKITLDAAATFALDLTSSVTPATGPAGDPVGQDFLAAKLTPFPRATVTFDPEGADIVLAGQASATIYGQTVKLISASSPIPRDLEFTTPHVAIPCLTALTTFTVSKSMSPEIVLAGAAPILGASVVFPVYNGAPASLPPPADAWGIAIATGPGLSATLAPLTAALTLAAAAFALTPVRLVGLVTNGANRARETYLLWPPAPAPSPLPPAQPPLALPQSQITLDLAPGALVAFSADPTQELTIAAGALTAILDRPLDASGQRLPLAGPALLTRIHTASSIVVEVGSTLTQGATSLALIAENALVPVGTPNGFLLGGTLTGNVINGGLLIVFPAKAIIPTFPDPYAAFYRITADEEQGLTGISATVAWTPTTAPSVTFALIGESRTASVTAATTQDFLAADLTPDQSLTPVDRLLDVSTNADQWGILVISRGNLFSFSGLVLQAPAASTAVFTVPGISWEPVVDTTNAPAWLSASSPDDGTPTLFLVAVANPAAIVPVATLQQYQAAAGSKRTGAMFTLPFGITAELNDTRTNPALAGPTYKIPSIAFPDQGLAGARVLSITGAPSAQPLESTLPGTAEVGYGSSSPSYGQQVLDGVPQVGPSVASFWDQDFGPTNLKAKIPVARIDLSGYGTSMFSDWHDPSLADVGIVRALFNVLLGRTGHEIITAQTWILPWCIRLQRTVTFDRSDGGEVIRHDTGWHAVAAGQFEFLQPPQTTKPRILPGPVTSLNNVRNIQFSNSTVTATVPGTPNKTFTFFPCTFDADVAFTSTLNMAAGGKNPVDKVVCTSIRGYADATASIDKATTLNADAVIALMQKVGRATGATGCVARAHGSGTGQFAMAVTSIGAAVATGSTPMLQTALFGTPQLPKDGQWSIAKRPAGATAPVPVDHDAPVPLTQGTSAGSSVPSSPGSFAATCFRLLDPEDAQSVDSPQTFYSVMQGTGTSKSLFEHPLINDAGTGLGFGNVPGVADAGALLGVAGIFPDIGNVLQIPANQGGLPLNGDGFVKTYKLGKAGGQPQPPDRHLLDIAIVHMVMSYSDGQGNPFTGELVLDATPGAPNWSLTLSNLSFETSVEGLGSDPLLTISGGFQAGASTKPGFTNLQVDYGSALSAVKSLLSGLGDLAKSLGGDADLDVGFTGNTLSVQQGFTLPTIPLGFGEIQDLGLNLGFSATIPKSLAFSVGIGSQQDPFQWVVSPLAGTGAIVLGVQDGGPNVYIEASLGLGLSLSVAVASGSASIEVGLALDVGTNEVSISASLTGKAELDVLGGLASASFTLSATINVTIEQSPHQADLSAQCSVGIHISICWVIDISFDGSWGFSETIALT